MIQKEDLELITQRCGAGSRGHDGSFYGLDMDNVPFANPLTDGEDVFYHTHDGEKVYLAEVKKKNHDIGKNPDIIKTRVTLLIHDGAALQIPSLFNAVDEHKDS